MGIKCGEVRTIMEINGHDEVTGEEIDQACDTRDEGIKMTPTEILEKYPNISVRGYNKLMIMDGDLICISETGRSVLVTHGRIMICNKKGTPNKIWHELKILKEILIDKGAGE